MNNIPVAFCFDDNLQLAAGVCISSLLENAKTDTFYDIFILHDDQCKFPTNGFLERLHQKYENFKITYRSVGDAFKGGFEIRGITIAAYYRLLIPEIIQEYDVIMYHDVDVIFQDDLADVFFNTEMEDYYIAGVSTPYSDISDYVKSVIGVEISKYIASGNLIFNSKKLREDNIVEKFKETAKKNWKYQDMDVINLDCKGTIQYLPPSYCVVGTTAEILADENQPFYTKEEAAYALKYGIIHYNGTKPWTAWCYHYDIWWEYYRKSIYFDARFYFTFYQNKLNDYDQLSLWKRIKILIRYFTAGRLKPL